jgi:three-Cys-motif partner protein
MPLEVVEAPSKGRQAALKAWATRRRKQEQKRSEAAKKAWKTRRNKEQGNREGCPTTRRTLPSVDAMTPANPNPEYWSEYSNLQHVKHSLIRNYLNGWFPKMTLGPWGCRRLLYIDTHAGRGKHLDGELGSPLVALNTLLQHQARDEMLREAEVRFFFIERDEENVAALKRELAAVRLPKNVFIEPEHGDVFEVFNDLNSDLEEDGSSLPPSFIFVDPYGFKLPGDLLRKLMAYRRVELFVNVIWRELDMAIQGARTGEKPGTEATLNRVFDGDRWKKIDAVDADARAEECADLFREMVGARWGTHIRMLDHGRIRYFLLHLTNHDAGRDLMKECIWKACPDGGYHASKSDNPRQRLLIQPEPDLRPLREWVREKLSAGPKRWQDLTEVLREELWLPKRT